MRPIFLLWAFQGDDYHMTGMVFRVVVVHYSRDSSQGMPQKLAGLPLVGKK